MMLKKSINDITLFILSFIYIGGILLSNNALTDIYLTLFAISNLILFKKINYKYVVIFILSILPSLVIMFIVAMLFSKTNLGITNGINITMRVFSLSLVSFMFILHIDIEKMIICAMKQYKLPVKIGYAILILNNSFKFLKQEFVRIQTAYKMRFKKRMGIYKTIYPLLISAIRYATICGMSLDGRGLNDNKTYVTKCEKWHIVNTGVLLVNLIVLCIIIFHQQ